MTSTRDRRNSREIRKYFYEELLPVAKKVLAERKGLFPVAAEPELGTYFTARQHEKASSTDFEIHGCESPEQLAHALGQMWSSQGYPELGALAESMSKLARTLHFVTEQSDEISPFIYVMF